MNPKHRLSSEPEFRRMACSAAPYYSNRDLLEWANDNGIECRLTSIHMARKIVLDEMGLTLKELKCGTASPAEEAAEPTPRQSYVQSQLNPPLDASYQRDRMGELERQVAQLREQLVWAQHADSAERTGGRMTLVISDIHLCGRDHMIECYREMCRKALILKGQYKPSELVVILNGDLVAGTGVYRKQHADSIVQNSTDQVKMGCYKIYEFDKALRESDPDCEVSWLIIGGNHDRSEGENIAPFFASVARNLGVNATYCGDYKVVNLASEGEYYLYAEHGYGYNEMSPSPTRWWKDMQAKLWRLSLRRHQGASRIRRVTHGHTHYFSVGTERMPDLFVDVTGGCQRNERTILGKSPRPMGFIAYISPKGYNGILDPIGVQPDLDTFLDEWENPFLFKRNMDDCGETLVAYAKLAQRLGLESYDGFEGR